MRSCSFWRAITAAVSVAALTSCSANVDDGSGFEETSGSPSTTTSADTAGSTSSATTGITATGGGTTSAATTTGLDDGSTGPGIKFDTPPSDTDGQLDCECLNDEFSYVWIANSGDSTVSKINTRTLVEEGRYLTREDANGNPSRTSVSIDGRAVAVANRHGGIIKIWAQQDDCADTNGMAGIQTSSGAADVYGWDQDECVAWYTPFPEATNQRPVQWTPGTLNEQTCQYEEQKIWTVAGRNGVIGQSGSGGVWVHRLDGETGVVEATQQIPEVDFPTGSDPYAPYGGATDLEDDFWFIARGGGYLVEVDYDTLDYEVHDLPWGPYGVIVDTSNRVWVSAGNVDGLGRFDPMTQQLDTVEIGKYGSLTQSLDGRIWVANYTSGLAVVDPETLAILDQFDPTYVGGSSQMKGVSVDIDGYIWAVRRDTDRAIRIDPDDYTEETYIGLDAAYTYSDMAGGVLANITCNPAG